MSIDYYKEIIPNCVEELTFSNLVDDDTIALSKIGNIFFLKAKISLKQCAKILGKKSIEEMFIDMFNVEFSRNKSGQPLISIAPILNSSNDRVRTNSYLLTSKSKLIDQILQMVDDEKGVHISNVGSTYKTTYGRNLKDVMKSLKISDTIPKFIQSEFHSRLSYGDNRIKKITEQMPINRAKSVPKGSVVGSAGYVRCMVLNCLIYNIRRGALKTTCPQITHYSELLGLQGAFNSKRLIQFIKGGGGSGEQIRQLFKEVCRSDDEDLLKFQRNFIAEKKKQVVAKVKILEKETKLMKDILNNLEFCECILD